MVIQDAEAAPAEILALVQSAYRAFAARDINALLGLLHEDVIWGEAPNPLIPSAGMRFGVDGVLEWLRIGKETETILAFEPVRFLVDGDTVAVIGWTTIEARPTGKVYDTDFVHVVTVADGRIVRFQEFFDTWAAAEAFRA
ncbi:MAG TPA: nuclear transport factor 2 family protein [Candidatus Limnocylindrales bacterium]|nr:nuclear transport factor 2 family protein [Candidatus Limnocylindrales bacterium]